MAKLTRKSYKRKKIAFAAVILGGVALVSSGFAAWVLSNTKDTEGTGKVNVGEIVDSSLTMKVEYKIKGAEGDYTLIGENKVGGNYCFDAAKNDTTGRIKYLRGDGEQLSILYKVTIESKENVFSELKVTFKHNDTIDQAVNNGFIVAPEGFYETKKADSETTYEGGKTFSGSDFTSNGGKGSGEQKWSWTTTTDIEVAFKWGSTFGGENPGLYFDSEKGKATSFESMSSTMNALYSGLNQTDYKIVFSASVN